MDYQRFDRLVRTMEASVPRRTGVRATIGAIIGLWVSGGGDAARKGIRRHEKTPCRNVGSNCATSEECCSGRCSEKPGGTGFRCARAHGKRRNSGRKRRGGGVFVPNGEACTPIDTCESADASCVPYTSNDPEGTYCLLQPASVCDEDSWCTLGFCNDGTCASACTVCASGCDYDTIGAAYAGLAEGSEIGIAPGSYSESLRVLKDMTFKRCGAGGSVSWTSTSQYVLEIEGEIRCGLRNLEFSGDIPNRDPSNALVKVGGDVPNQTFATVDIEGCSFGQYLADSYSALYLSYFSDVTIDASVFTGTYSYGPGGAIYSTGYTHANTGTAPALRNKLSISNSALSSSQAGNTQGVPDSQGGALWGQFSDITITNSVVQLNGATGGAGIGITTSSSLVLTDTLIADNSAPGANSGGGGILMLPGNNGSNAECVLTIAGTTTIASNSAAHGSGIAVLISDPAAAWTVFGASSANVFDNTGGANCEISFNNGVSWTEVVDCLFPV